MESFVNMSAAPKHTFTLKDEVKEFVGYVIFFIDQNRFVRLRNIFVTKAMYGIIRKFDGIIYLGLST